MLFAHGRNAKQVQTWLGHHSPGFTLDRYVHLMDDGVGDAEFMDDAVRALPSELPLPTFGDVAASYEGEEPPWLRACCE